MDNKLQKRATSWPNKKYLLMVGAGVLVVGAFWHMSNSEGDQKVAKNNVWFGTAVSGDLDLRVQGFGKLKSKFQRLLTAPADGIVEDILLKPGAVVTKGDVILKLSNPDLDQEVNQENLLLNAEEANLRQLTVNQQRELLAQEARLAELKAQFGAASFNLEATTKLVEQGIVSQLDHKRAQLEASQLETRLEIEGKRLTQLSSVHQEAVNIQKEKISQQHSKLKAAEAKQSSMTVKASIDGVLQKLPIELGQTVPVGHILAFVGGTDQLIAEINIPQSQVEQIQLGQLVTISTRQDKAQGKVSRINPIVTAGSVLIEVNLNGVLPSNARPDLTVDATIHAGLLQNVIYIERPVNVQPESTATLYRLDESKRKAQSTQVTFGIEAGKYIQITNGAASGEHFILSDTSLWQQYDSFILD